MTALLIVGHGTRDASGAEEFRRFTGRVGRRAAQRPELGIDGVGGGFIELSPPPVKDTVAGLVGEGLRDLIAVPLILLAAGHAKGDIPAALARERARHPGLRTRYARALGPHPVILDLLRERLAESNRPDADAILLVGRGTTDPDANADLYRAGRLLWETTRDLGVEQVEQAFVSLARPSVAEGLARLRRLGARRVTVLPFFLFPGVLPTRIVAQSAAASADLGMDVTVAGVIGDCDALADLVLERYAEVARGPVSVNCDACVYRIALPGFEHRVGAAQHPHDHPDDPSHAHAVAGHGGHESDGAHAHPHMHSHESARAPVHAPAPAPAAAGAAQGHDSAESRHAESSSVR
ncbi:MAG TPA: sirohydrochlorin chelatase [Actinocrinis sp.]|jgi:sirohydrochlorin cobaltochelatase|uniref:sirohydrochlorin chelatase n=1 Tax=Actinocrinis sp. TaxID=1920516 RepID=UPI002DDCFD78|nr:sirohydrochlorin chelatase [Actinocrinis sp.]HEV3173975.1 sirohydrochlorin chelatase [Actinocrinis sp.]